MDETWKKHGTDWMEALKRTAPLVHSITNYVTVNDCANALLAIGARPVMSHDPRAAAEITCGSQALELSLGATEYMEAMFRSAEVACEKGIPRVLDPVGISGSTFRRDALKRMLSSCPPTVIRGNYAELHALLKNESTGTGVDAVADAALSTLSRDVLADAMQAYLRKLDFPLILIASGREDIVVSRDAYAYVQNGSPRMAQVTGTGCMATELVAAFQAVGGEDRFQAALLATAFMGIAGERADTWAPRGTGSFHIALIDALSTLTSEELLTGARIHYGHKIETSPKGQELFSSGDRRKGGSPL